jgi:hypothetical protein
MELTSNTEIDDETEDKLLKIWLKSNTYSWAFTEELQKLIIAGGFEPSLTLSEAYSLFRILKLVLWGEKAAWMTSAQMVTEVDNIQVAAALTSQAQDEAKHFLAIETYMELLVGAYDLNVDWAPTKTIQKGFNQILKANSLAKKVAGMHLMVEPVAMAVFSQFMMNPKTPILGRLLELFSRDEARHIAIGTIYLPHLVKSMSLMQKARLALFQSNILWSELDGLAELEKDFGNLDISTYQLFSAAKKKQISLMKETFPISDITNEALRLAESGIELRYRQLFKS